MTTKMNFNLSSTLTETLTTNGSGNGVYAYAFAFDSNGNLAAPYTTLVNDGVVVGSPGTPSYIDLPGPNFSGGVVYVLIQQGGDGTLPTHIANGTDGNGTNPLGVITPSDSSTNNYSYQLFEASLGGSPNDLGDISALNTFGFGATLEVKFQDGSSDYRGFQSSADTIFTAVGSGAVQSFNPNIFPSDNRLGIGPASITGDFPASDWTNYVNALAANTDVLNDINIVTSFTGTSLQATPMLSVYGVEYDAATESFWLVPDLSHGGTNTDWIKIPKADLINNIYTQSTDLQVYQGSMTGPNVTVVGGGFTPNNAAGTVARNFIAGFDAGYWGGTGTSPNPLVTTLIDLDDSTSWSVTYAYNGTLNPGLVTYSNVLGLGPGTPGGGDRFYDPWAQAIQSNANAYGWSFSDLVSAGGVNPQITMWDATVPGGQQVQTINLYLYDNTETAVEAAGNTPNFPNPSFQTPPAVYVAPPAGGYLSALSSPTFSAPYGYGSQMDFSFNFGVSTLDFAPYLDTPINFRFYAPDGNSQQVGADGFITLAVTAPNGDWYNYTVVNSDPDNPDQGIWSLTPGAEHTTAGSFSLFNLPTTADGSTSWYQLEFGTGANQTLYNIYAASNPNPDSGGLTHAITSVVVDRAVSVTVTPETSNTSASYSLNFAPGGSPTYDIANVSARALHDINADGYSDLIFQNTDGTVYGWEENGTGTIADGQIGTPDPSWQALAVADFYGDGGADILFQNSATSEVYIWEQNGLSIEAFGSIGTPGLDWQVVGAGDINGDGAADIIFQNSTTGEVFGWEQHGLSTIVGGAGTIGQPGTAWDVKGVADFDADSNADLVFQHSGTGEVVIYNLDGLTITSTTHVGTPGTAWQIAGTGDFNGDGYADIAFQNTGSGDVFVWEMTVLPPAAGVPHNSVLMAGTVGTPGTDWQVAGTGDFNGDGMTDFAFQNTATGEVYEWQMNGLQITQAISLGNPGTDWHIV